MNEIPKEIFGAWVASKEEILRINEKAKKNEWGAHFKMESLKHIMKDDAHHLVVPMLRKSPLIKKPEVYRCYVWLKVANENKRICALMDFEIEDIKLLLRPPEKGLHCIIFSLIEGEHIVNIDEFYNEKL